MIRHEKTILIIIVGCLITLGLSVTSLIRSRNARYYEERAVRCQVIERNPDKVRIDDLVYYKKHCAGPEK